MTDTLRYIPDVEELTWTFGGASPVRSVRPGTTIELWTEDAFGQRLRSSNDRLDTSETGLLLNPQTGPFYVEGAEPGDTLAIHFISIEPARTWGASATIPYFGSLTSTPMTATLQPALDERVWIYEVDSASRTIALQGAPDGLSIPLPLDPMHGTVGVAPAGFEARSSLVPGDFGGNMDTPEMRVGSTCFLGVNVEGALFSLGDGHCRQGEGETCGVAVEAAMNTTIAVDLVKGVPTSWPRIESDDFWMSVGSARPLEDAFRIAHTDMVRWISTELEVDLLDAYQFVTQISQSPIANVCDPNYSVVCKIPKTYLPNSAAYRGTHHHLRDLARAWRSAD
jgi:acetamidase/formamidase